MPGYNELRAIGQRRQDAVIEIGFDAQLWPIQKRIARALSVPRAQVAVASANSVGKTYLAAHLALAFFWTFRDSIVIVSSATESQLKDALYAEIRLAYGKAAIPIEGRMAPADFWLRASEKHYLIGVVARGREGLQGRHAPHKLLILDEATALDEEMASGVTALLASGDARILAIANPTDDANWFADFYESPETTSFKVTAFDTPNLSHFTNDEIKTRWGQDLPSDRVPRTIPLPPGASLTTPEWLDSMLAQGMGPGSVEWTNRVMAEFWSAADTQLILGAWLNMSTRVEHVPGYRVMGIDLAPYGDDENVIAYRNGNRLVNLESFPAIRPDMFWALIRARVDTFKPDIIVWDADGVGAGSYTDAELAVRGTTTQLHPFRGGTKGGEFHNNNRTKGWWQLRRALENGAISLGVTDPKLEEQLISLRYKFLETGKIKVESKQMMKRRNLKSPDRADAVMYAFIPSPPVPPRKKPAVGSDREQWDRDMRAALGKTDENDEQLIDLREM